MPWGGCGRRINPTSPIQKSPNPNQQGSQGRWALASGSIWKKAAEPFLTLLMLMEAPKPPSQEVKPWWQLWKHRSLAKFLLYSTPLLFRRSLHSPGQALRNPTRSWHVAAGYTGRWQQETREGEAPKELRDLFAAFSRESWDTSPKGARGPSPECPSHLFSRQLAALGRRAREKRPAGCFGGERAEESPLSALWSPECTKSAVLTPPAVLCAAQREQNPRVISMHISSDSS